MQYLRVENMQSSRGNKVPNQFEIATNEGTYFQSYQTLIAFRSNDQEITLDENSWDYSRTTMKYLSMFLGHNAKVTRQKIKDGEYKLTNLN